MMVEESNRAENLDMIELTLCRKRPDKDAGGRWVKGLYCSSDKKRVPRLNLNFRSDLGWTLQLTSGDIPIAIFNLFYSFATAVIEMSEKKGPGVSEQAGSSPPARRRATAQRQGFV